LQSGTFQFKFLLALGIQVGYHRFDEGLILSDRLEIKATSTVQCLTQATFEVAM
jgi:hypothetical protein